MGEQEKAGIRQKIAVCLLGIVFLGVAVYSNVLYSPFVYDDRTTILENETTQNLTAALSQIQSRRYVGSVSFAINYAAGWRQSYGYHLVNNAIHAMAAACVFWLAYAISLTPRVKGGLHSALFVACAAACLFVVHPLQTQAVTYISQRFTSLATLLYVASLALYITARTRKPGNHISGLPEKYRAGIGHVFSLVFAVLAMKTKEIAFTLPVLITFTELYFFPGEAGRRKRFAGVLPYWLLLIAVAAFEIYRGLPFFENIGGAVGSLSRETVRLSRADYFFTEFRVIVTYLRLFLFPFNQVFDYDYPVFPVLSMYSVSVSALTIFLLLSLACLMRRNLLVSFGILWFFVSLSVESSIIPIRDVINEHRMYLPSIGLCIAAAGTLDRAAMTQRWRAGALGILVTLLAVTAYARNSDWASSIALWEDTVTKAPLNARAHNNLGVAYKEDKGYEKATMHFSKALEVYPGYPAAYYNLGDVQYELRNYDQAVELLNRASEANVDSSLLLDIKNKLARAYSARGEYGTAITILKDALARHPRSLVLLNNLGVQYIKQGEPDNAVSVFERALLIGKEKYLYSNLAIAYAQKNEPEKSREVMERAAALKGR